MTMFRPEVTEFIDRMDHGELREIATLAMDLAWPPYIKRGNEPARPYDNGARDALQTALLQAMMKHSPGTIIEMPIGRPE